VGLPGRSHRAELLVELGEAFGDAQGVRRYAASLDAPGWRWR
jgi:hypothetical protein